MTQTYYTYTDESGAIQDAECETQEEAEAWAQERWAAQHEDEPPANGETVCADAFIVGFQYDDLEKILVSRQPIHLEFEAYHGDEIEHSINYL